LIDRYTLPELKAVWSDEEKLRTWLEVELAIVAALAAEGLVPKAAALRIRRRAAFDAAKVARREATVKHDVLAFVEVVGETIGPDSRYFHMGVTSSDILDTALALLLRRATAVIVEELEALRGKVVELARAHRATLIVGRTHGMHAEPTSLGLKFAVWANDLGRAIERIARSGRAVEVGKISGAVGNYSHLSPRIEDRALGMLGLKPERPATQVVQRDRHADYVQSLALAGASLERIGVELRSLQRTEIAEAEEPFTRGQKGSSAMPHKRNPIVLERVCGLARLLRANAGVALENVALWHERDISHSSAERVILPDSTIALHYMARCLNTVLGGLKINKDRMRSNIEMTGGRVYSQRLMLALMEVGWARNDAYEKVQQLASRAESAGRHLGEAAHGDRQVVGAIGSRGIDDVFDPRFYTRHTDVVLREMGILRGASVGRKNRRQSGRRRS
jgi:adenylosuccinate lyase